VKNKLLFVVLMIIPIIISATVVQAKPINFNAHLSTRIDEGKILGQGQAIFKISDDGQSISYRLIVANIENVTMAHIHVSPVAGMNGLPAVWLYPAAPPALLIPGRFQGTLQSGTFTASNFGGLLAGKQVSDLVMAINEGRAYVNVHTTENPSGEIRGALKLAA